jgi:hypothetical protein
VREGIEIVGMDDTTEHEVKTGEDLMTLILHSTTIS